MPDSVTAYRTVAHNTGVTATKTNNSGVTTVANTLTLTTPVVVSPDTSNTTVVKVFSNGLMEFRDEQGNLVRSRQKTLRQFVEKLIRSGVIS